MSLSYQALVADSGPTVALDGQGGRRTIHWGHPWQIGTAAYWIDRTAAGALARQTDNVKRHRLGQTLRDEVAACLLGGFGMPYELGLAYFEAFIEEFPHSEVGPSAQEIEALLREAVVVRGRVRHYRFPRQRAHRLASALEFVADVDLDGLRAPEIRDWLLGAPGIGMKTASWIVRNWLASDEVAILDIHVLRAAVRAGVFPHDASVATQYRALEDWFIAWARSGGVSAADLDSAIWSTQARLARP